MPVARGATPASLAAVVNGTTAVLGNARVQRTWKITQGPTGGITTSSLVDTATGRSWAGPSSSDFSLTVNGVPLTSSGTWEVLAATAHTIGGDTAQVVFRLGTPGASLTGAGLEIDRTYTLHAGSATIEVESNLVNHTPAPLRVGAYTIDEL
ncbi:MAG: hypothetical protein JO148_14190, partial [Acidimicrobiia bacterium]|nr:hypothetical protein [Acidimicrobiia bacterium]